MVHGAKKATLEVRRSKVKGHKAEIGHKIPFGKISQELFDEFYRNLADTYCGQCLLCYNISDVVVIGR